MPYTVQVTAADCSRYRSSSSQPEHSRYGGEADFDVQGRCSLHGCRAWCSVDRERVFSKGGLANLLQMGPLALAGDPASCKDLVVNALGWWVLPAPVPSKEWRHSPVAVQLQVFMATAQL